MVLSMEHASIKFELLLWVMAPAAYSGAGAAASVEPLPEKDSATAPTARCAMADPVPKAIPCIMVLPMPESMPPLCACGAAATAEGAAAAGGAGLAAGAAGRAMGRRDGAGAGARREERCYEIRVDKYLFI